MSLFTKVFALLMCMSLAQFCSALTLNGAASYQQLRKEFYIAALYLQVPSSDPKAILASNNSKRMALRVTAKRWSPRRWSLMWQNDIAINNPYASDDTLTNQLMLFSGFLEKPLTTGDEIIIDYIPTVGTKILINNIKIMQTSTSQLFNYLLNSWIGKLPPSGEFKTRILTSQNDDTHKDLLNRYKGTSYNNKRSNLISGWIQARKDTELAAVKAIERKKKAKKDALAKKAKDKKRTKIAAQKKAKAAATPKLKPRPVKTYVAPKKVAKKKKPTKKKKVASLKVDNRAKSKKQLAAQNQYYQNLYQWELRREIRNVVLYPDWAKKFGQKGSVNIDFTVNRKAEVSGLSKGDGETSALLISEVKKSILDVVPFILPPDALTGNSWRFSFTYIFDPRNDSQPYLKKPAKPKFLMSSKKISRAEYNKVLSQYIDEIKATIAERIEYPVWSKKLNHKGLVEIEIQINRDGMVNSSKDIKLSRHETLNQEVRNAIEESQPLPPLPEELKLNHTSLKVRHKFK